MLQDVSIDGVPQIFKRNASFVSRCFWICLVVLSIIGSSIFIYETIRQYRAMPVYSYSYVTAETKDRKIELPDVVIFFQIPNSAIRAYEQLVPSFSEELFTVTYYTKLNNTFEFIKAGKLKDFQVWSSKADSSRMG